MALLAPGPTGRSIGLATSGPGRLILRAFGARELALAYGVLKSLDNDRDATTWVRASAGADAVDATAVLLAARSLGPWRTVAGVVVAAAATAVGLRAADRLD